MADFFTDLLTLVHPDRLLHDPRATGAGIRVAVVDSGIDADVLAARHPALRSRPIVTAAFPPDQPAGARPAEAPSSPHGTTVADIILAVAPGVELYSADVFGPSGSGDAEAVVRAIYHALDEWDCRVINLSLGVTEARLQPPARRVLLQRAIEEAYHRGTVVVAAAHNDHPLTRSYPAAFAPPLVSVDKGLFDDPLDVRYQPREHVEFQAHGRGAVGPFAREPATSWAAPHVAGVAARLLSLRPDLRPFEVKALLTLMARARRAGRD
jgi:subtilisin family serine protease